MYFNLPRVSYVSACTRNHKLTVIIQMTATEHYFSVVLFIVLNNVVLAFESENEILEFDHTT